MSNPYQAQLDEITARIVENQALLSDPELKLLAEQEILELDQQKQALEAAVAMFEQGTAADAPTLHEHVNCVIEIRQGTGGDEAFLWATELLRMYMRYCEKLNLKVEFLDELVIKVKGRTTKLTPEPLTAYNVFQYESGVHRVQRVPTTEAQGRVHTSTASVAVLPEVHPQAITIREEDLEWQFTRSGGAGGQNVNKVNTAVRITHKPSGLMVSARQERTQSQNREIALELLRSQLWEIEEEKRLKELGEARSAIGRAQRSEKIRTYNFPQNRITDHRINESWYSLETIMEGDLEAVVLLLREKMNDQTIATAGETPDNET